MGMAVSTALAAVTYHILPSPAQCEDPSEKLKGKDYSTLVLLQAQLSALTREQNAEHVPSLMKHFRKQCFRCYVK